MPPSQTVQVVVRDPAGDFRPLGNTLSEASASRSDVPTITNGVVASFTREMTGDGRFYLTIPASAVAGLSAVPVGGIRGTTTTEPDAPTTQRPQVQGLDTLPRAGHHAQVPPELLRFWHKLWQQRLDDFFARTISGWNLADWLKQLQATIPIGEAVPSEREHEGPDEPEAALPRPHPTDMPMSTTTWGWASGLVMLGMMIPRDSRQRSYPQARVSRHGETA